MILNFKTDFRLSSKLIFNISHYDTFERKAFKVSKKVLKATYASIEFKIFLGLYPDSSGRESGEEESSK